MDGYDNDLLLLLLDDDLFWREEENKPCGVISSPTPEN